MRAGSTAICSRGGCARPAFRVTCFRSTRTAEQLGAIGGIIISGGPRSVTEPGSPRIHPSILSMNVPILGICYGHQLLAATMPGGVVKPSYSREYGLANLQLDGASGTSVNGIFADFPAYSRVWVSHGDSVETLPDGFEVLGSTEDCAVAAMANAERRMFGVQFHPEVTHTEHGQRLLDELRHEGLPAAASHWKPSSAETIEAIKADIRARVGEQQERAVLRQRRRGFHRGLQAVRRRARTGSRARRLCRHRLHAEERIGRRDGRVSGGGVQERPAARRVGRISGGRRRRSGAGDQAQADRHVVSRLSRTTCSEHLPPGEWLLGQGTIYPDTIESGGTKESALIKTHHNRVPELLRRIEAGEIVEPLAQFYKDEVREIGRALGLPARLIEKQPFPGPGLAVRFLCARRSGGLGPSREARRDCGRVMDWRARILPVRGVGVQGDERTYAHVALLTGAYDEHKIARAGAHRSPTRSETSIAWPSGWPARDRSTSFRSSR